MNHYEVVNAHKDMFCALKITEVEQCNPNVFVPQGFKINKQIKWVIIKHSSICNKPFMTLF